MKILNTNFIRMINLSKINISNNKIKDNGIRFLSDNLKYIVKLTELLIDSIFKLFR